MIDTISITDLKQNTAGAIKKVRTGGKSLIILQRSKAAAVLMDIDHYRKLEQALEDAEDLRAIKERADEPTISFEEVVKKLGL